MFDWYIREVGEYVDGLRTGGKPVREYNFPGTAAALKKGLPIHIGPQANRGILLREDTFIELGGPDAGSCAFFIMTENLSLIKDGRITLIGPDLQETIRPKLPFGQVVMVGGNELNTKDPNALYHLRFIGDEIEGYMVRSLSRNLWSRVSKDAGAKGFSFEVLGRALMSVYKSQNIKIQAVEILFVTSSKEDVGRLADIEVQVQKERDQIQKEHWKSKGYDIDCILDCGSCANKSVCDELRKVLRARRKAKGG